MSIEYNVYDALAADRLQKLVDLQKEEKDAVNIVFSVSKKTEQLSQAFLRDPQEGIKLFRECDAFFRKTKIELVSAIEYKELYLKTEKTLQEYTSWINDNYPSLLENAKNEEIAKEEAKRKEAEEALSKFFYGLFNFLARIFCFFGAGVLLVVGLFLAVVIFFLVRCHGS